ncbi:hypothetical protein [Endozoicomonas sp. Mp262]|uniref:type III secretion HpaP family protein n=1 Tax=Endozoicomonas sp. Mp262 TaxID=2919499 RepID=UPI0021D9A441
MNIQNPFDLSPVTPNGENAIDTTLPSQKSFSQSVQNHFHRLMEKPLQEKTSETKHSNGSDKPELSNHQNRARKSEKADYLNAQNEEFQQPAIVVNGSNIIEPGITPNPVNETSATRIKTPGSATINKDNSLAKTARKMTPGDSSQSPHHEKQKPTEKKTLPHSALHEHQLQSAKLPREDTSFSELRKSSRNPKIEGIQDLPGAIPDLNRVPAGDRSPIHDASENTGKLKTSFEPAHLKPGAELQPPSTPATVPERDKIDLAANKARAVTPFPEKGLSTRFKQDKPSIAGTDKSPVSDQKVTSPSEEAVPNANPRYTKTDSHKHEPATDKRPANYISTQKTEALDKVISGDAILQRMQTQAPSVNETATVHTQSAGRIEQINKLVESIQVSAARLADQGLVHIQMKGSGLQGTSIQLSLSGNQLHVEILATRENSELLSAGKQQLTQQLNEACPHLRTSVAVLSGQDNPSDGRSRQQYVASMDEDDME